MDYRTNIKPLEDAGKSDSEIAAYLSALCRRNLPCGAIVTLCSATGAVVRDLETEMLGGPLWQTLKASPDPLAAWFLRHVWMDRRESITLDGSASDVPGVNSFEVVVGFARLASQMAARDPRFAQLRDGFIMAAGGLRYPGGVTAADVATARSLDAESETASRAEARLINAKALFSERMTAGQNAAQVWSQAWIDAEAL